MTTSETIEAEQLACWIDGDRDTLPSAECSVAMWAMRPDLAPSPRVTLDDVLSRVTSGPFCETQEEKDGVSEDDFVEALFTQVRNSRQNKVSLDDILTRVESGPFAEPESDGVSEKVEGSISTFTSANNNRWWRSPFLTGGLAVALVLLILIPTQFTATVAEDSMFATFELEEALPAEEVDIDINSVSKQAKSFDRSATVEVQRVPATVDDTVTTQRDRVIPAKTVESPPPKTVDKSTVNETVIESIELPPPSEVQAAPEEPTNSYKSELAIDNPNAYDLVGDSNDVYTNLLNGKDESVYIGIIEDTDADTKEISKDTKEDVGDVVSSLEMSADSTNGIVDGLSVGSVSNSVERPSKRTKKSRGRLSQKMRMSMGAEAEMSEGSTALDESASEAVSSQLPDVLTEEQQRLLERATNIESVLNLCDVSQPTQSLQILWTASRILLTPDAIAALKLSSNYDHGDVRYLKRNWLLLSSLLYQTGQEEDAMKYQQLAASLP